MNRRKAAMQVVGKWLDKELSAPKEPKGAEQDQEEGNFCVQELEMLLERMEIPVFGLENKVEKTLLCYILGEEGREECDCQNPGKPRRIDIQSGWRDHEERADFFSKYLDVMQAPRGRWPARDSMPFLRQMVINLVACRREEQGCICTVDGLDRDRRTAVLKETAAGNIVERAWLLARYKEADEAFELRHFEDGTCRNKGYQDAYWGYYAFKNNKIREYGMTVVSHTEENAGRIADGFLEYQEDLWAKGGVLKVPVGTGGDLAGEIKKILAPVLAEYSDGAGLEERREEYRKARKDFLNQYMAVELMQKEISGISGARVRYAGKRDEALLERQRVRLLMQETEGKIRKLEAAVDYGNEMIRHMEEEAEGYRMDSKRLETENRRRADDIEQLERQVQDLRKQLAKAERERPVKNLLFTLVKKAGTLEQQIEELRVEYVEKHDALENGKNALILAEETMEEHGRRIAGLENQILTEKGKLVVLRKEIEECKSGIDGMEQEIANQNRIIEDEWKSCLQVLEMASGVEEKEVHMTVINDGFWEAFDSPDPARRAQALGSEPWFTDVYNRKRERLFYYALRLHREFVRSSAACEWNLRNLMLLWENPDVTSRDRENAVPSLINTLYLVSPVLSMDCRTSGGFLRDVRRPGELGLLVLDQAEQMPAHLAPGLLYRFGKALVMGGRVRPPKEKNAEGNVLDNAESLNHLGIRMELEDAYLSLTGF